MKVYSNWRSEIIEQAWRRSFHMWFDVDIPSFWITMEADLSLPTKSNRKISMMTSFNEELYNSSAEFLKKIKIYDGEMQEFSDDMLVTLVTKMIHNTIQKLNNKWEPLWNIFIKTPKAKAKELEQMREDYLWKISPGIPQEHMIPKVDTIDNNESMEENIFWKQTKKSTSTIKKTTIKRSKQITTKDIPQIHIDESPFSNNEF